MLIQGPPGTGKTILAIKFTTVSHNIKVTTIGCGPSNIATDNFASRCNEHCPEAGALRYHGRDFENRGLKKAEVNAYFAANPDEVLERVESERVQLVDEFDSVVTEDVRLFYRLFLIGISRKPKSMLISLPTLTKSPNVWNRNAYS